MMVGSRRLGAAAMVVMTAVGLSACGTVHPTLEDLRAVPGATSQFPGSVELASGDQESSSNAMAKNPAVLSSYRCAGAPQATYSAWFQQQLTSAGWTPHHTVVQPSDPSLTLLAEWVRGDRAFDLYAVSEAHARSLASQAGKQVDCVGPYRTLVT